MSYRSTLCDSNLAEHSSLAGSGRGGLDLVQMELADQTALDGCAIFPYHPRRAEGPELLDLCQGQETPDAGCLDDCDTVSEDT